MESNQKVEERKATETSFRSRSTPEGKKIEIPKDYLGRDSVMFLRDMLAEYQDICHHTNYQLEAVIEEEARDRTQRLRRFLNTPTSCPKSHLRMKLIPYRLHLVMNTFVWFVTSLWILLFRLPWMSKQVSSNAKKPQEKQQQKLQEQQQQQEQKKEDVTTKDNKKPEKPRRRTRSLWRIPRVKRINSFKSCTYRKVLNQQALNQIEHKHRWTLP